MRALILCLAPLLLVSAAGADSDVESWNLPIRLNEQNTKVTFELDSTWHSVHGAAGNISGEARLKDPKLPNSVNLTVHFPINAFDTDNNSRDKKMRRVMDPEKYPVVTFEGFKLDGECTPQRVLLEGSCEATLNGEISIKEIKKAVTIPITIKKAESGFIVQGSYPITWAEFGVEDPSILVAHVAPVVRVDFEVALAGSSVEPTR